MKFRKWLGLVLAMAMFAGCTATPATSDGGNSGTGGGSASSDLPTTPANKLFPDAPPALSREGYDLPISPAVPDKLYMVSMGGMSVAEQVMVASLQGVTAKTKSVIYTSMATSYSEFMRDFRVDYDVDVEITSDGWALLDEFKDQVEGYIVCDMSVGPNGPKNASCYNGSLNVATSLAGIHKAIIVDKSLEEHPRLAATGLKKIMDVSDKDEAWLVEQEDYKKLNRSVAVELCEYDGYQVKMRDYAIMANAICFYDFPDGSVVNTPLRQKIIGDLDMDAAVIGWGFPDFGEDKFVEPTTRAGCYYIGCDHAYNISTLSAFTNVKTQAVQNAKRQEEKLTAERGKHYVTILMSDGDNLQWLLNGWGDTTRYQSSSRGKVNLNWGLPSSVADLAPTAVQTLFNKASDGTQTGKPGIDEFVMYSSGGYMYPSMYPREELSAHAAKLAKTMKRLDTSLLGIIDFDQYNTPSLDMWDKFTEQDGIDAVFYVDYSSYSTNSDRILWSNGKPIIASRARFWKDLPDGEIDSIVQRINRLSTDPTDPNAYSLIMVHVWSRSVTEVTKLVEAFDDHVEVVNASQFVDLIVNNVKH